MDPILFRTIASGDIFGLKQLIATRNDDLLLQMTHFKNTTLHVAVKSHNVVCVEEICKRCPTLLLMQQNMGGDTPLHIAARLGSSDIVEFFIGLASQTPYAEDIESGDCKSLIEGSLSVLQQLVRKTNKENDTALHEAVRYHWFEIVKLLTVADPEFDYLPNNSCETPLYMAVEDELYHFVVQIIQTCTTSAHNGPRGRTALHAAVMRNNSGITKLLLEPIENEPYSILKERDENGCTALHFAAYLGQVEMVVQLLEADPSIAYIPDNDGKTALHYAAANTAIPSVDVIEAVRRRCPDSWELVDNNGQSFLHVAVEKKRPNVILYVLVSSDIAEDLLNKKDNNGNTPLHLAVMLKNDSFLTSFSKDLRVNKRAFNKDNLRCLDIAHKNLYEEHKHSTYEKLMRMANDDPSKALNLLVTDGPTTNIRTVLIEEVDKKGEDILGNDSLLLVQKISDLLAQKTSDEEMEKVSQTHLLVATLIATVTFAAGFTLPGGYNSSSGDGNDQNTGMATLIESPAFIAFMVSNSIAMLLSTFAVFIHFWSTLISDDKGKMGQLIKIALWCTFLAILAMVVAFVTGVFAVLSLNLRLAIPLTTVGCSFFLFCLALVFKVHRWATPQPAFSNKRLSCAWETLTTKAIISYIEKTVFGPFRSSGCSSCLSRASSTTPISFKISK